MYLPADDMDARRRVTAAFLAYRDLCKARLWDRCVYVLCLFVVSSLGVGDFPTKRGETRPFYLALEAGFARFGRRCQRVCNGIRSLGPL